MNNVSASFFFFFFFISQHLFKTQTLIMYMAMFYFMLCAGKKGQFWKHYQSVLKTSLSTVASQPEGLGFNTQLLQAFLG